MSRKSSHCAQIFRITTAAAGHTAGAAAGISPDMVVLTVIGESTVIDHRLTGTPQSQHALIRSCWTRAVGLARHTGPAAEKDEKMLYQSPARG